MSMRAALMALRAASGDAALIHLGFEFERHELALDKGARLVAPGDRLGRQAEGHDVCVARWIVLGKEGVQAGVAIVCFASSS